jgi:hypothetical protein
LLAGRDAQSSDTGTDTDELDAPRLRLGRRAAMDGDLSWPPEPQAPRDGVLDAEEPAVPVDGMDAASQDARDPDDVAAFERPPAGFDPEAFSIEIEPILDRRPARLARFEPFQPVGVRMGTFTVFPEAEIAFAAFDNVFRSSSGVRRDVALDVGPTVRAVSNWRVHALEFRATGISTFHNQFPTEDDRAIGLEARGRIDVSRRTNVELLAAYDRAQELRGSINAASAAGDRTEYDTTRAAVTFNHRFNRLALQFRGSITDTDYQPVDAGGGIVVSNDSRDQTQREAAVRLSWSFKPTLAVFGEAVANTRAYKAAPSDGISRDSSGERVRVGVSFGTTGQILRGEVAIGHAQQRFDDQRLAGIDGVILDANLAWRVNGLTSVLFTARSDIGESTLAGSGGALSQTVGAEVRHAFRRRLIGTAGISLAKLDYEGISLHERGITGLAGLEYFVNREVTLFGRYQHVDFESSIAGRNYNTDEVRVGVRIRR